MADIEEKQNVNQQQKPTGKGKKKGKKQTIDLHDFVASLQSPAGFSAVNTSKINWADLMEDDDTMSSNFKKPDNGVIILPNAPKSVRGPDFNVDEITHTGPFIAYMRSVPSELSENDVQNFFGKMEIKSIQIERGGMNNNTYGAVVEFYDRPTFIEALCKSGEMLRNKSVRITHTDPCCERRGHGRDRYNDHYGGRDRERNNEEGGDDRTEGDWRRSDKPFVPQPRPRDSSFNFRDGNRDFNRSSDYDRGMRRDEGRRGYGSSYDRSSYNNHTSESAEPRQYQRLNLIKPTKKAEDGEFKVAPLTDKTAITHSSKQVEPAVADVAETRTQQPAVPKERKKLNLLPPTRKTSDTEAPVVEESKARESIFGGAKPVDTTKKLQEYERKHQDINKDRFVRNQKPNDDTRPTHTASRSIDRPRHTDGRRGSDSGSASGSQSGVTEVRERGYRNNDRSYNRNNGGYFQGRGDRGAYEGDYKKPLRVIPPRREVNEQPRRENQRIRQFSSNEEHLHEGDADDGDREYPIVRPTRGDTHVSEGIQSTNRFQSLGEAYMD